MIEIDSIWINSDVIDSKFCCNLEKCKGICCCLKGGRGAPLDDSETKILDSIFPLIKDEMDEKSLAVIDKLGLYEGNPGDYYVTCIDDEDCVFVYYDNNIAKCIIEKAFNEGKIDWKKPVSCHLYPIRINNFGGDVLRYSRISECKPAAKFGKEKNVELIDFLKEPLERKYGKKWYEKLKKTVTKNNSGKM
jgi:hypothetical protein